MLKGNKSEKIRKLLAKRVDRQQIVKDLKVSPQLVYAVAVRDGYLKKKVKKAKKQSKIIKAVKEMKQALDVVGIKKDPRKLGLNDKDLADPVNHPPHYTKGGIEVIDFIEAKDLNYRLGNVVKYVVRCGRKLDSNPVQDLEKALWYLKREIDTRKGA